MFSHPEFHKKEATLMSSRNATREDFEQVIQYIGKEVNPLSFITNRVPFRCSGRFSGLVKPIQAFIKVVVEKD